MVLSVLRLFRASSEIAELYNFSTLLRLFVNTDLKGDGVPFAHLLNGRPFSPLITRTKGLKGGARAYIAAKSVTCLCVKRVIVGMIGIVCIKKYRNENVAIFGQDPCHAKRVQFSSSRDRYLEPNSRDT